MDAVDTCYCRKCTKILPSKNFYESVDGGLVDTNKKFSVCKECIILIYNELFSENQSMEKTIHKMCRTLNVSFSNEALSATRAHITTLLEKGSKVNAVFSIYKQKLLATQKTMNKNTDMDMSYEDIGTIYTTEALNLKEIPIPQSVVDFWGNDVSRNDIEYLEMEYANFKATHRAETYAETVLLKQICHTMLSIKKLRLAGDDTVKLVKELQDLMKNLAISPNVINATTNASRGDESFGLWIQDIEQREPAQWLSTDPRSDPYRDVLDTDEYFQKYIVRPLKNFILNSRDFNVEENVDVEPASPFNIIETEVENKLETKEV